MATKDAITYQILHGFREILETRGPFERFGVKWTYGYVNSRRVEGAQVYYVDEEEAESPLVDKLKAEPKLKPFYTNMGMQAKWHIDGK